jgi:serine/threonine protein kinase
VPGTGESRYAARMTGAPARIVGRYALYRPIASGGMATVHLGRLVGAAGFGRTVAIKRLHEGFATDPEFVSMLLDEARLAARIHHPNVVPVLDVIAAEGQLLLVMDYVRGESLAGLSRSMQARDQKIDRAIVAAIAADMLHGLHAAHEVKDSDGRPLGIVHRDVSPQNVLVGADGAARVLDFGIAKAVGRLRTTKDGSLRGKVPYMAPEQLEGANVDRRTDVYAAAVVVWEMLAARRLFTADNDGAVVELVLKHQVTPPAELDRDVSEELSAVVMRGLAREKTARFESAREMALAIERAVTPASPALVGEWVQQCASESLATRDAMLDELEHALPPESRRTPPQSETTSAGPTKPAARSRAPRVRWAVAALLASIGVTVILVARARSSPPGLDAPQGPAVVASPAADSTGTPPVPSAPASVPTAVNDAAGQRPVPPSHSPHVGVGGVRSASLSRANTIAALPLSRFTACYQDALRASGDATGGGTATLHLVVANDGTIVGARFDGPPAFKQVGLCISRATLLGRVAGVQLEGNADVALVFVAD